MSCCLGKRVIEDDKENEFKILDFQQILQDFIWDKFVSEQNPIQRLFLKRSNFNINVAMHFFHFETIKQKVKSRLRPEVGKDAHILDQKGKGDDSIENDLRQINGKKTDKGGNKNSNSIEIATDFINDTDREQTYKFRLEKTRKAVLTVGFEKGFTVGGKATFTVSLPKVAPSAASNIETEMRINVTKSGSEQVEETVVLETTSDIRVKERSKFTVKVVLTETKVSYDFSVWCRVSMPKGVAPVSITRKKDGEIFYSAMLKNMKTVFDKYQKYVKITTAPSKRTTENYVVDIENSGTIDGVRLCDQRIVLESNDIEKVPKLKQTVIMGNGPIIEDVTEEMDGNNSDTTTP